MGTDPISFSRGPRKTRPAEQGTVPTQGTVPYASAAYSANASAWLVAWHASVTSSSTHVRGRIIRDGQTALTSDFDMSPAAVSSNWEMGAACAWSSTQHTFLVPWQDFGATLIRAQRISETGQQLGGLITVDATAGYERDPAVGYDPDGDRFVVAYGGCVANNDCFVRAQRFDAASGSAIGTPIPLDEHIAAGYIPELAWDGARHRFLAVWYRAPQLVARTLAGDGTLGAQATASPMYASYDANSVAWNPVSGTFVAVTHSSGAQDAALELDADGNALNAPGLLIESATSSGNFNPRIAARSDGAQWLAVASDAFANLAAQRLTTSTRLLPLPDAGMPGQDDAGAPDAGAAPDAGRPDAGHADAGQPDGGSTAGQVTSPCGCAAEPTANIWGAALLLAKFLRRRAAHLR
jgi:hypothetical protein